MKTLKDHEQQARRELANRLFFRLYQCANMLHKTGTRAVESEGLTTQQWAILGALSRPEAEGGMNVGELARYLMVSRQNLAGLIGRMERDGHIRVVPDGRDGRSRRIQMSDAGRQAWDGPTQTKIAAYYEQVLQGFSIGDVHYTLQHLLKLLDNMVALDQGSAAGDDGPAHRDG